MKTIIMTQPLLRGMIALLAMGSAGTAVAQEADGEASADIIVTATKRAESLQDVPISVSAITGDALSKSRVTQADKHSG